MTLSKMPNAARSDALTAAFEKQEGKPKVGSERLEQVFAIIGKRPVGKTCDAIVRLTERCAEIMSEYKGSPALDAGLLAAARSTMGPGLQRYSVNRLGIPYSGVEKHVDSFSGW